jgi:hypothetical protein
MQQEIATMNRIIKSSALGMILGTALATGASALPAHRLAAPDATIQARMVCNDDGRCWRRVNPVESMERNMRRSLEGRSVYRNRDWDRGRRGDWDYRRRSWDDRGRDLR